MTDARPVALVTGAARRIGAGIVRRLHGAGYDIALQHRESMAEAQALAAELESARADSVRLLRADLLAFDRLPELVAQVVGWYGRLDVLVNNASAFFPTDFGTTTPAQWDGLFGANVRAPFFLAQSAAPHLRASHGAIVNLTDIHGEQPLAGHAVYGMGKAALIQMTRALALELAPDVRVNAVSPGAILWPEQGKPDAERNALLARTPLGRIGTVEEIADAVLWLARDATYTTGQVIRVDGGRTLAS
jgi:pteridine reductase